MPERGRRAVGTDLFVAEDVYELDLNCRKLFLTPLFVICISGD
jgi:hypothetical protein